MPKRVFRVSVVAVAVLWGLGIVAGRRAEARCPHGGWPSSSACRDVEAYFMPGAVAQLYLPARGGTWLGAGVQIAPVLWSHNTEKFGPGQGKLIFDVSMLDDDGGDDAGVLLLWRLGAELSFERNASRTLGIPFFGAAFGGLNQDTLGDHGFFEATVGVHAAFYKNVVATIEGGYLFPFSAVDDLRGYRASLAVNFSLW